MTLDLSPFLSAAQAQTDSNTHGYVLDMKIPVAGHSDLSMLDIPPFLRALLMTDGTVTKVLEAYFWEPIDVQVDVLTKIQPEHNIALLNTQPHTTLLFRQVALIGKHSGQCFSQAQSLIRLDKLNAKLRDELIKGQLGIGVLLCELGMDTYRKIESIKAHWKIQNPTQPAQLWIHRLYRIFQADIPLMAIQESFPLDIYQPPNQQQPH